MYVVNVNKLFKDENKLPWFYIKKDFASSNNKLIYLEVNKCFLIQKNLQ